MLAAIVAFAGCARHERAGTAHPLGAEVASAQKALLDMLATDAAALVAFESERDRLLALRAQLCASEHPLGALASVENLRGTSSPERCFAEQDARLLSFIRSRAIEARLAPGQAVAAPTRRSGRTEPQPADAKKRLGGAPTERRTIAEKALGLA
ncbi:hypothetical protein [Caldimonas sp. KR1-144]|uniref:hypothetical protein n=1 Tax=Caldimonas sp. KR1-144 TaxID=3400911 RepID=UPI003C0FEB84